MYGPAFIVFILVLYQTEAISCQSCRPAGGTGPATDALIIGRYQDWKYYTMKDYGSQPSDMNVSLYTHLVMSSAAVSSGICQFPDLWVNLQQPFPNSRFGTDANDQYKGLMNQVRRMKLAYPHLKTILEVRDIKPSTAMSQAITSSSSRTQLVNSCVSLMLKYGFDGMHIHWDVPNPSNSTQQDVDNYVQLVATFRSALSASVKPNSTLSTALLFDPSDLVLHYNLVSMAKYLDWITVQAFWYMGGQNSIIGHFANLYPPDAEALRQRAVTSDIEMLLNLPIPSCKVVVAIPSISVAWTMPSTPTSLSFPSLYSAGQGQVAWTGSEGGWYVDLDVMPARRGDRNWVEIWDSKAQATVYYNTTNRLIVSSESPRSLRGKAQFLVQSNLAGVYIDDVNSDSTYNLVASVLSQTLQTISPCPKLTTKPLSTVRTKRSSTKVLVWSYPAMPIPMSSAPPQTSSIPSTNIATNETQSDAVIWAMLLSLPLDRSLAKYSNQRMQTEEEFFISDATAALSISRNQIVNCAWAPVSPTTSRLSFTLLPSRWQTSDHLSDQFKQQMQDPDSLLRQGALLQFAPPPPITITNVAILVRQCPDRTVIPASSECRPATPSSSDPTDSSLIAILIIIGIPLATVLLISTIAVIWHRLRRRLNSKWKDGQNPILTASYNVTNGGVSSDTTVSTAAVVAGPVQSSVSYHAQGLLQPTSSTGVMDPAYNSADEAWVRSQFYHSDRGGHETS